MLTVALGVVIVGFMTRLLGAASYGAYTLLISFGTIVQLVADGGLYLTLTRQLAEEPRQQTALISNVLSLRLALLVVVFTVGLMLTLVIPSLSGLTSAFLLIALGLSAQSLSQLFMGVFQQAQLMWPATLGDIIGRLVQLGTIGLVALATVTLSGMALAFALGAIAALVVHQLLLPQWAQRWRLAAAWPAWRALLATSWPLGALLLLSVIYFRVDTIILSLYRDTSEVGYYGLAYRIIESALFFPAMLGGLLLPRLSEQLAAGTKQRAAQLLGEGVTLSLAVAAAGCIVALVFSEQLVALLSGSDFVPAAPLLRLLAPALLILFAGNIFGFALVALKQQLALLKLYAALVIVNIGLNLLFIPHYGAPAAAVTTLITEGLAASVAGWLVWHLLPWRFAWPKLLLKKAPR